MLKMPLGANKNTTKHNGIAQSRNIKNFDKN